LLVSLLLIAGMVILSQRATIESYAARTEAPAERFHSGDLSSADKIARLELSGTIMPPFTERWLEAIDAIGDDDQVRGVLLVVDSPGGLAADSDRLYSRLRKLGEQKPIVVSMLRLAASGGYYVSMAAGPRGQLFAEPTAWTGSIGVILPRYNLAPLAEQFGVKSEPLVTGPLKNSLDPLSELSLQEREVWSRILDDSFQRFLGVIEAGRPKLTAEQIRALATGQVYTAQQALDNGLIDAIGDEDQALTALKQTLGLSTARVVEYEFPVTLVESLLGLQSRPQAIDPVAALFEASTPRAMYLFGWPGQAAVVRQ
jgi:protease-4